ncbi:MAG: class II aldolase/adducin family protein [Candidatus Diapherotrites archaeon]
MKKKGSDSADGSSLAKFSTIFMGGRVRGADIYTIHINELIQWGRVFAREGLLEHGREEKAGNLSFRGRGSIFITASGADLARLHKSDFTEVLGWGSGKKGDFVFARGAKEPSSESIMHFEIYRARKDAKFIFHGHSMEILRSAKKLGIPCTKTKKPYGTTALVWETVRAVEKNKKNGFVVLKGHGFVSLGGSAKEAGDLAIKVQKSAERGVK